MKKTSLNTIPKAQTRSKIKPLEDKILLLTDENETLLEEMYEKGLRTRPTIMAKIEEKEADTLRHIQYCIDECEKETGRKFFHQNIVAHFLKRNLNSNELH